MGLNSYVPAIVFYLSLAVLLWKVEGRRLRQSGEGSEQQVLLSFAQHIPNFQVTHPYDLQTHCTRCNSWCSSLAWSSLQLWQSVLPQLVLPCPNNKQSLTGTGRIASHLYAFSSSLPSYYFWRSPKYRCCAVRLSVHVAFHGCVHICSHNVSDTRNRLSLMSSIFRKICSQSRSTWYPTACAVSVCRSVHNQSIWLCPSIFTSMGK